MDKKSLTLSSPINVMMKIVSIVLQVVFVSIGALGGLWLKAGSSSGGAPAENSEAHGDADATHGEKAPHAAKDDHDEKAAKKKEKKAKKEKKKKKKDDHGGGGDDHGGGGGDHGESGGGDEFSFMKFGRQFIVPVIRSDNVNALVVIDINLELNPNSAERAYSREPKIRDALLSALLTLSNEGAFEDNLLEDENVLEIRTRLLAAAQTILGDDAIDILILSIARQDF